MDENDKAVHRYVRDRYGTTEGRDPVRAIEDIARLYDVPVAVGHNAAVVHGKPVVVEEWDCMDPPGKWNEGVGSWIMYARKACEEEK